LHGALRIGRGQRGPLVSGGRTPVSAAAALSRPPVTVMPSRGGDRLGVPRTCWMTRLIAPFRVLPAHQGDDAGDVRCRHRGAAQGAVPVGLLKGPEVGSVLRVSTPGARCPRCWRVIGKIRQLIIVVRGGDRDMLSRS